MKRKIALFLTLVMSMGAVPAFADSGVKVNVNGEEVVFADAQPVIINSRTMIPLRGVFEKLGYKVEWWSVKKTANLIGEETVSVTANSNIFYVDGEEEYSDVPAQIINNRMYLPLRAIGEAADMDVKWDSATKTAYIYDDDRVAVPEIKQDTQVSNANVEKFFSAKVLGLLADEYEDCIEEKGYTTEKYVTAVKGLVNDSELNLDKELSSELLTVLEKNSSNSASLEDALEAYEEKMENIADTYEEQLDAVINSVGVEFVVKLYSEIEKTAYSQLADVVEKDKPTVEDYKKIASALKQALSNTKAETDDEKKLVESYNVLMDKLVALTNYAEKDELSKTVLEEVFS